MLKNWQIRLLLMATEVQTIGTYWSAYRAVADEFNIGYTETSDIQKALQLLQNYNYVICSVGNGLFTTGGHYIVIYGIDGDTLKIYDPYLYSRKI